MKTTLWIIGLIVIAMSVSALGEPVLQPIKEVKPVPSPLIQGIAVPEGTDGMVEPAQVPLQAPDLPSEDPALKGAKAPCLDGAAPTDDCDVISSVSFPNGIYNLPNGINIGASNVVVDCNGATLVGPGNAQQGILLNGHNNVEIRNCKVTNYNTGFHLTHTNNTVIKDSVSFENPMVGLSITGGFNITFDNLIVDNNSDNGMRIWNIKELKLINSIFTNNTASQNIALHDSCDVLIANNLFRDFESRGFYIYNDQVHDYFNPATCSYNHIIENNSFYRMWRGMSLQNFYYNSSSLPLIIRNNYFDDMRGGAIWLGNIETNTTINNNTFIRSDWYDIGLYYATHNVEAYGNVGTESRAPESTVHGFYVHYEGRPSNNIAWGNSWDDYEAGIWAESSDNLEFYENTITNSQAGIHTRWINNLSIHSNNFVGNDIGMQIRGGKTDIDLFLNNIYNSNSINLDSGWPTWVDSWEMSYAGYGNYWGHSTPPCFNANTDVYGGAAANVVDSNAICTPNSGADTVIELENPYSWYFFSFDVTPQDDSPSVVMSSVGSMLEFVKSLLNGQPLIYFFDDPWGSTLEHMTPEKGYWMKVFNTPSENVVISGSPVDPCTRISLSPGIHWISYLGKEPQPIEDALSSIAFRYDWVKSFDNEQPSTYDPTSPPLSDLKIMQPGHAYRIKIHTATTLNYCS